MTRRSDLVEVLCERLDKREPRDADFNFSEAEIREINRFITNREVHATHIRLHYEAMSVKVGKTPRETSFVEYVSGRTITTEDYFQKNFRIHLRFPNLAMLEVVSTRLGRQRGQPTYVPLELLTIEH